MREHVVPAASNFLYVERALVERLPKKSWLWEAPGFPKCIIGSSEARWLKGQLTAKLAP
jgi:hypothetical protein